MLLVDNKLLNYGKILWSFDSDVGESDITVSIFLNKIIQITFSYSSYSLLNESVAISFLIIWSEKSKISSWLSAYSIFVDYLLFYSDNQEFSSDSNKFLSSFFDIDNLLPYNGFLISF